MLQGTVLVTEESLCVSRRLSYDCLRNVCVFQGTFPMTEENLCVSRQLFMTAESLCVSRLLSFVCNMCIHVYSFYIFYLLI